MKTDALLISNTSTKYEIISALELLPKISMKHSIANHTKAWPMSCCALLYKFTLVDKIKRKFRFLLFKISVFNVCFGQSFLHNSVKFLHRPRTNDQSYPL